MVECLVWDQDAAGSNPVASTTRLSLEPICAPGSFLLINEHPALKIGQNALGTAPEASQCALGTAPQASQCALGTGQRFAVVGSFLSFNKTARVEYKRGKQA